VAEEPAVSLATFDIAIVGAGPGGSTLARLLAERYRVLLVDRRSLDLEEPEPRFRKPCGGLVAPDAQAMLARLGLGLPQEVLVGPQLFVVRTLDLQSGLERDYQRFYFNVDRERFDRWLAGLVPGTVERGFATEFVGFQAEPGGYRLRLRDDQGVREVRTRILVGADGARSKVRAGGVSSWPFAPREYLAVQEWYAAPTAPPWFSVVFDPTLTDFYGWTIPKGNAVLLGAALPSGPDARQRFETLKERLAGRGFVFGPRLRREAHPILRPVLMGGAPALPEDLLLIGEAGGFISPSSAEGFSYAFKSAVAAAEVLNQGLEAVVPRFARATTGLRMQVRGKNLKAPFMYNPFLRKGIMASGLRHLPRVERA
jgi:geranylgeranyl diphosphate/geranylgeranyl-bacteriochlorophyllide a reductase